MAEDWDAVAAEVALALGEVGFVATLHEWTTGDGPDDPEGPENVYPITVLSDTIQRRDSNGLVTGAAEVLTVAAGSVRPEKGWHVTVNGKRHRIAEVQPLAPGGVDLLYDLRLEA